MTDSTHHVPLNAIVEDARTVVAHDLVLDGVGPDVDDLLDRLGGTPQSDASPAPRGEPALDDIVADARLVVGHDLTVRQHRPPEFGVGQTRRRRAAMVVVAAALVMGAAWLAVSVGTSTPTSAPTDPTLTARTSVPPAPTARGPEAAPSVSTREDETARPSAPESDAVPDPVDAPAESGTRASPSGTGLGVASDAVVPAPKIEHTVSKTSLAELDRQAQDQWRAGDRAGAAKTFEKIVRLGKRSSWAEQAFGELFLLDEQLAVPASTRDKRHRAYLARFPKGRYADTTRAELCRRQPAAQRESCWRDYLDHHPNGAHRAEALQHTRER